jgi:hypothetical protein
MSNEMLKANTESDNNNNIEENATKHAKHLPGNKSQQSPTTTTLNNTEQTHCENSTHTITTANRSNYIPYRKTWSQFCSSRWLHDLLFGK